MEYSPRQMLLYFLMTYVVTQVTYYSSCLEDGPVRQTNKCSGLRVGTRVLFTAKIEVRSLLSSVFRFQIQMSLCGSGSKQAKIVRKKGKCE
jgi:hypothetical protein